MPSPVEKDFPSQTKNLHEPSVLIALTHTGSNSIDIEVLTGRAGF